MCASHSPIHIARLIQPPGSCEEKERLMNGLTDFS